MGKSFVPVCGHKLNHLALNSTTVVAGEWSIMLNSRPSGPICVRTQHNALYSIFIEGWKVWKYVPVSVDSKCCLQVAFQSVFHLTVTLWTVLVNERRSTSELLTTPCRLLEITRFCHYRFVVGGFFCKHAKKSQDFKGTCNQSYASNSRDRH